MNKIRRTSPPDSGSTNGGKVPRFSKIFKWVCSILVTTGVVSLFSFTAWQEELNKRKTITTNFAKIMEDYVEWGKKARNDIADRGYKGHFHDNKSQVQLDWEGHHYSAFKAIIQEVTQECRPEATTFIKDLRCANTKYFLCYDAMKNKISLSQVVDKHVARLKADCGSVEWSVLTEIGDINDLETLNRQSIKIFQELQDAKTSAVSAMPDCCRLSYLEYINFRIRHLFYIY